MAEICSRLIFTRFVHLRVREERAGATGGGAVAAICRSSAELAESRDPAIRTIIRKPLAAGRNYDAKLVARLVSFMNVRNAAIILPVICILCIHRACTLYTVYTASLR